jgi:hypothetical protein
VVAEETQQAVDMLADAENALEMVRHCCEEGRY